MTSLKFGVLAVLGVAINVSALGDTIVCPPGGGSFTLIDQVWTASGSPYRVSCNLLVAGLEIGPGVDVVFEGDYLLEVGGVLTASGTEADPITFRTAEGVGCWQGMYFIHSAPGSELEHCIVETSCQSGIRVESSSLVIRSCTIRDNGGAYGGGVRIEGASSVTLERCTITGNSAGYGGSSWGGGVFLSSGEASLTDCTISGNVVSGTGSEGVGDGGGVYSVGRLTMRRCEVRDNTAEHAAVGECQQRSSGRGGGILAYGSSLLENCTVRGNRATAYAQIQFCCFWCAEAYAQGGGLAVGQSTTVKNCVVADNSLSAGVSGFGSEFGLAQARGSGVYVYDGTTNLSNCSIAYNTHEGVSAGGGTVNVKNSIVYFNGGGQIAGTTSVTYSDVQGGYPGTGNINFNPVFLSRDELRIIPGSRCIDAGDPAPASNDACFPPSLGLVRNDIGAHGGPAACQWAPFQDCNRNFVADEVDLETRASPDCNGNGIPDECDIAAGSSLDANADGVPDECPQVSFVEAGPLCWHVQLLSPMATKGGELGFRYDPRLVSLISAGPGPDFPAGAELSFSPPDVSGAAPSQCSDTGLRGLGAAWINASHPDNGDVLTPPGIHHLLEVCFAVLPQSAASVERPSPLEFVECLGLASAPIRNLVTDEGLRSIPLFTRGTRILPPSAFRRGDANDDGRFDVSDAILILVCLFDPREERPCPSCADAADSNDDGRVDMSDAVYLMNWRFRGGAAPAAPFAACNRDPTDDTLSAETCAYRSC